MVAMYEAIMQGSTFPAALQHDAAVALTHLHLDAGDTLAAEQVRCCCTSDQKHKQPLFPHLS